MPPDPDEHWKTINAFVHRFEVAWQHGGCPNIDDFLPKDGDPLRLDVLKELILVDIERRWAGEPARLEDYFERYPEAAALINGSTVAHELADQKPVNADPDLPERIGRYRVERILGQGSFGVVYLAHDDDLSRRVAIKVPHAKLIVHPEDAEEYRTEARTVAGLDHQNIVPVFDVGKTPEHPIFVVSKFIDGSTLARRIRENPLGVFEAAELVKVIAETLHYAHKKGLVHRDIKPGNILLEFRVGDGGLQVPYVADFGLALLEENVGRGPRFAGTPAYMSPEQARGEGNRVNGCSDIFSLGVVFYELLTGRRPFHAREQSELLDQITGMEARPPRQWVDTIPKELERICLKALSKRASDRYTTALDFADDLRHFLDADSTKNQRDGAIGSPKGSPGPKPSPGGPAGPLPPSENTVIKIVPQGLRSFDTGDADFFLELLPGPRDREGLPNSIRFWKTRVEEMDAGNTFAVGLIYGPSGCGKSSLVKAGLLPRLCPSVLTVYVEAAAEETEARLLSGLRRRCPSVSADLGLKETLASLRRGQGMPSGQKVLIVLDQFEQWLHAAGAPGAAVGRSRKTAELVNALRQCDGVRVQCIVMVRDDFWLAVSRFLKELEIELLENRNSAMVDLFDTDHALKVLAAFGRAFDKLADSSVNAAKEQKLFMARAIEGLAQDDKVICVRLALFAEMMKSKPWTLASLNAVGGTSGLGVTFLEEKFSAATTPAAHRHHQKAARGVLKALLPEPGADIKGHVKSSQELMAASGYTSRPDDFASLIKILDSELRLITPTEAEGKDEDGGAQNEQTPSDSSLRFFQLAHDYLVPSLRDWLTRKQRETTRGRTELLLDYLALAWNAQPKTRQLPSLLQWLQIRSLARKANWSAPERKMMRRAARYHGLRISVAAIAVLLLLFAGWDVRGRVQASTLHDQLFLVDTPGVSAIVREMPPYRRWLDPLLYTAYAQAEKSNNPSRQLHASLALLPVDEKQKAYLHGRLLQAKATEAVVIRDALLRHGQEFAEGLWKMLEDPRHDRDERLRAACALAAFAPDDARWDKAHGDVAAMVIVQDPLEIAHWTDALQGVRTTLVTPLAEFLEDEKYGAAEIGLIARVYGRYADSVPDAYSRLEKKLVDPIELAGMSPDAKVSLAKKQANACVALMVMGHGGAVWEKLKHRPDPTLRSLVIERLAPAGVDFKALAFELKRNKDVSIRQAILLTLSDKKRLSRIEFDSFLPVLRDIFRSELDSGVHAAAGWLLREWKDEEWLRQALQDLPKRKELGEKKGGSAEGRAEWHVNRHGQTMVIIRGPTEFWMGEGKERKRARIDYDFAIAAKEVTVADYFVFDKNPSYSKPASPSPDCPINDVVWDKAAAYCNWLSEQENLLSDQLCYEWIQPGDPEKGMKATAGFLQRSGYRLPTEAEWECACKAGAETSFGFGEAEELLGKYARYAVNSVNRAHSVGSLKPNDFGLFDMHGNIAEWTHGESAYRVARGGDFRSNPAAMLRSAHPTKLEASVRTSTLGFRVARTVR